MLDFFAHTVLPAVMAFGCRTACLTASFFIYLPFARSVDNELYEAEQATA